MLPPRWPLIAAFGVALVAHVSLWARMRAERRERHRWKGFSADHPDDLTGFEQFERGRYTARGQRLYPWFVLTAVALLAAGILLAAELL